MYPDLNDTHCHDALREIVRDSSMQETVLAIVNTTLPYLTSLDKTIKLIPHVFQLGIQIKFKKIHLHSHQLNQGRMPLLCVKKAGKEGSMEEIKEQKSLYYVYLSKAARRE